MKQLQFNDHNIDMFITITAENLRFMIGMLSVNVKINDVEFDDEKCIVSAGIDFNVLLEQENYNLVKDTVTNVK
ncbi:hypothetical protein [Photobacterium phosphoreum]|uniref:hypothetical protein n=1 Tax=Photobacterium phosphoreum TaxID=659 RepID=UPI000D1865EC|nr:hypothetical protein [Photobacterium phosphoreum]PSU32164.1 hypothetical protein CTM85_20205 [Photobacterium phosphoreum]